MCESKEDRNPKIFTLENCVKITQEPPPDRLIHIVKHHVTLTLSTSSEEDLKDWITALQTVAFCDTSPSGGIGAIEEDNDLYCSSFVSDHLSMRENLLGCVDNIEEVLNQRGIFFPMSIFGSLFISFSA